MKKLLSTAMFIATALVINAQLPNTGFDVWEADTAVFGYAPFVPNDTFPYYNPQGWYSVNAITGHQDLGSKSLVTETNALALFGSSSAKLVTDSINVSGVGLKLIVPGFIVNGSFTISLADLIQNNTSLAPSAIPGAGTAINSRKQKLQAYVQYNPIPGDSLLIWAVLKKKDTIIAEAKLSYKQTALNTVLIEKDFVYTSCTMPDTAVVMIASSTPDFSTVLGGSTGIEAGSVLLVDSVMLTELPQNFTFPPFANRDETFTNKGTAKTIAVLANDYDCASTPITVANVGTPINGTAVRNNDNTITYTPNANFIGSDSFSYTISNANGTATTNVFVNVFNFGTGINEVAITNLKVYPNPTSNYILVETEEKAKGETLLVTDVQGKIAISKTITSITEQLDITGLAKGMYFVKINNTASRILID